MLPLQATIDTAMNDFLKLQRLHKFMHGPLNSDAAGGSGRPQQLLGLPQVPSRMSWEDVHHQN